MRIIPVHLTLVLPEVHKGIAGETVITYTQASRLP